MFDILVLAALVPLGAMAIFARLMRQSWVAPSAFTPLLWFGFIAVPVFLAPDYWVSSEAVWIIVLLIFSTVVGAFVGEGRPASANIVGVPGKTAEKFHEFMAKRMLRWSILFTLLSCVGIIYQLIIGFQGFGLSFSLDSFLELGNLSSLQRYYTDYRDPWLLRMLRPWYFPAALLGGMCYPLLARRRDKILTLSWVVPVLVASTAVAARSGALLAALAWLTGMVAVHVYMTRGIYRLFERRRVLRMATALASVIAFVGIIQIVRLKFEYWDDLRTIWRISRPGMLGYLAGFSRWYETQGPQGMDFGANTFAGVFDLVGLKTRSVGLYLGVNIGDASFDPNIFTAFRGLMEDFSLPGAVIVTFLFGLIAGWAYRKSSRGRFSNATVLSAFYAVLLFSPMYCPFIFNGLLLAWVIAGPLLIWLERKFARQGLHGKMPGFKLWGPARGVSRIGLVARAERERRLRGA